MQALFEPTQVAAPQSANRQRYIALDAFRGFIMLILVSEGFGLAGLLASWTNRSERSSRTSAFIRR
jgi:hypothetical protein